MAKELGQAPPPGLPGMCGGMQGRHCLHGGPLQLTSFFMRAVGAVPDPSINQVCAAGEANQGRVDTPSLLPRGRPPDRVNSKPQTPTRKPLLLNHNPSPLTPHP